VEDIIDTGITLAKLVHHLASKGAASVSVCVLLDKVSRRVVPLKLSGNGKCYVGFEVHDRSFCCSHVYTLHVAADL
jgi:hypoxanthine phosphoribosyltransferase